MAKSFKVFVADMLTADWIGEMVRRVYRNNIPWDGGRLRVLPTLVARRNCAAIRFRTYEAAERRMVSRFVRPGDRVIELGSSIGGISSVLKRQVGPRGEVALVEARADLLELALSNVAAVAPGTSSRSIQGAVDYTRAGEATITF